MYERLGTGNLHDSKPFGLYNVNQRIQDFPAILEAAEEAGVEYVIVEQDASVDRDPMEAAKMSREYLKTLGL